MQIGKKSLSLLLVLVMLFTTLSIFIPETEVEVYAAVDSNEYYYPAGTSFLTELAIGAQKFVSGCGGKEDASKSNLTNNGYTLFDKNLNGGINSGTDRYFIYMGYKTGTDESKAIRAIAFYNGGTAPASLTYTINGKDCTFYPVTTSFVDGETSTGTAFDLNKGVGGDTIFMYYTTDPNAGQPITKMDWEGDEDNDQADVKTPAVWLNTNSKATKGALADLNAGAGGDYIYLFYNQIGTAVDTDSLRTAVNNAKAKIDSSSNYTSASITTLTNAYNTGVAIVNDYNSYGLSGSYDQTAINNAVTPINNALNALQTTVYFNGNGGNVSASSAAVTIGTASSMNYIPSVTVSRTGYTFKGWATSSTATSGATTVNIGFNQPLYAIWTPVTYSVEFNGNGSTNGSMTNQTLTYDENAKLSANAYEKVGHNFNGWNTLSDGTGTAYTNMADVKNLANSQGATVTLYAQWQPIEYTITWKNYDGSTLRTDSVPYGTMPEYGSEPTREGTAQHSYTFAGWSPNVVNVVGNATYTATYTTSVNNYTVTWVNEDGTVLKTDTVPYGTVPTYNGATPTKAPTAEFSYVHSGWNPSVSSVTGNVTYTATYTESRNTYTVTWKNYDGTVLDTDTVAYGVVPSYTGATPEKAADAQFTYTHLGWTPEVVAVTGDATYTATYSTETNTYTVTWKNEDGTVLETDENVLYGTKPTYDGATPTKNATAQYTYTHSGWTPEIADVTGDVTYTATFSSTVNEYTITWVDGDGKTLKTEKVAYGETPEYSGDTPTKAPTAQYSYTFNNTWSPAIATVTKDATYTAQFSSTVNEYTITWVDGNGNTLYEEKLEYNAMPNYSGAMPPKAQDEQYTYTWNRTWSPALTNVTKDAIYTAQFTATLRSYTVTWENYDGTVLKTDTVAYGTIPEYKGDTPTKDQDTENTYTFAGWTTEVVAVTGNVTYTAKFDSAPRKYTVTWVNYDGTTLYSEDVAYGTVPVYGGATPEKAADVQYTYTHSGWTPAVAAVTGEAKYTATYTETFNKYTVTFKYFDGATEEREYIYGTLAGAIEKPENTVSRHDEVQHYSYSWPALSDVTGNVTYEETETKTEHNFIKGELTRPVFTNGVWSDGYYTYTCNVDGDAHTKTEDVKRADYSEYTEALNKLTELLEEELDAEDIAEIKSVIAGNTLDDNLIESEQDIVDTATEKLKVTFDNVSEHLTKFTVTFIVNGVTVKTETVVNGKSTTAPADPAGYYDDNYHYTFTSWDNAFTNVAENITVTAIFASEVHNFTTHTHKNDTHHTDECSCGYTKDVEHSFDSGVVTKAPTCIDTGIMTYTCSVCDGTKTEQVPVDKDAHKEAEEYIVTLEPTCTAKGEATYNCVYCAEILRTIELNIVSDAHKWETEYTVDEKASCEKAGSKSYHCEYCDAINAESVVVIPQRAHELVDTTVEKAATCITTGIMNQACINKASDEYEACEYTTTREIEKDPNNHAEGHNTIKGAKDATCTATGYTGDIYWSCCGVLYESGKVIPVDKEAHTGTPTNVVGKVEATCYSEGYTGDIYYTCCNALYEVGKAIEKTAHTKGEVVIENKIPATATEVGSYEEVIYCTVCREEISREKKTYSVQDILPGLPENGKVVVDIDENGNSTESLDEILGKNSDYKSDDIIVDEDGNITATEDGEAVITVTTPDGEIIDITVNVRTLKTITFIMKDDTVTIKAYNGDRLTSVQVPTVNDFITEEFTYVFKAWSPVIATVAGDTTYTAIYTEPCDYDEFDRLSALFDELINGGLVDEAVLENNKDIIDELISDIEAINAVRNTRDKSEQAIIDAVVEKLDELVLRIYPDAGSTLEIFGAAMYYVGTVIDLKVMKMPLGTVVSDVQWSSSDEDVIFFADGKLYAFGTGTATVTATKGLITATKTITVVAGGNTRSINFTAVDLTVKFLIEGYKALYDSTLLYWSDDTELRFRIDAYMNPLFKDYKVYFNDKEIELNEDSYYVIPAGSGDIRVIVAGELYEDEDGNENKDPVTKWSLWDWILDFFRKIGDFFRNLFS